METSPNTQGNVQPSPSSPPEPTGNRRIRSRNLLEKETVLVALKHSFVMLRPDIQWKNPVMFVVEVGALLTLIYIIKAAISGNTSPVPITYFIALDFWLFLTILFANFATALAEARGKAQAESLRHIRRDTIAFRVTASGKIEEVSSAELKRGDKVVVETGHYYSG